MTQTRTNTRFIINAVDIFFIIDKKFWVEVNESINLLYHQNHSVDRYCFVDLQVCFKYVEILVYTVKQKHGQKIKVR